MPPKLLATLIGLMAILLWTVLALTTALTNRIPSFELLGLTFAVATTMGAISWLLRPGAKASWRQNVLAPRRPGATPGKYGRSASAACSAIMRSISRLSGVLHQPKRA